jgi:hypothetical protein
MNVVRPSELKTREIWDHPGGSFRVKGPKI